MRLHFWIFGEFDVIILGNLKILKEFFFLFILLLENILLEAENCKIWQYVYQMKEKRNKKRTHNYNEKRKNKELWVAKMALCVNKNFS